MIAHIYPLKRMPRAVTVFDYHIPDDMEQVVRGQLVLIPFRRSVVHGIVARVSDKPLRGIELKSILSIDPRVQLRDEELSFYESLAQELAQSVSSLLYSCLPSIPKRTKNYASRPQNTSISLTIPESESSSLSRIAKQLAERHRAFAYLSDLKRMAAAITFYLREKPNQKCVILAPTVVDAERLSTYLQTFSPILLTATQNQGDQFAAWTRFHHAETGMIIGTKNVLFCTDKKTTSLFLIRSGSKHHGHHEQNPRFDAKMIAEQYEQMMQTNLFYFDILPRVDDLHLFTETNIIGMPVQTDVRLVDMEQEYRASAIGGSVSIAVCQAIQQAIDTSSRVLCVLDKKTRINRLQCTTCKKQATCEKCKTTLTGDEMSVRCVRCGHTDVRTNVCTHCKTKTIQDSAQGNAKLTEILKKEFPKTVFCSVDKEHPTIDPHAQIVLSTSYYLEELFNPFQPDRFAAIILLDADGPLYRSTYHSVEDAGYELERWKAVAFCDRAPLIVQTHTVTLFEEYLLDPILFLKKELALRETYEQPPFRHIALLQFSETEPRRAELRTTTLIKEIRQILKQVRILKIPSNKPNLYIIEIRFTDTEKPVLLDLFNGFPDDVLIDIQADSR